VTWRQAVLLGLVASLHGCGLMGEKTTVTRAGWPSSAGAGAPSVTSPPEGWGLPGVRVVTIIDHRGAPCTLVFRDGLYVGGTC
jgi:hypothetical protein